MQNLTLTRGELTQVLKVFAYAVLGVAASLTYLQCRYQGTEVLGAAARSVSIAMLLAGGGFVLFYRHAWRIGPLARWMKRPVVHGVWLGWLKSSRLDAPLPIVFVIRQTYLTLSIQSLTRDQEGCSRLEALISDARLDATWLSYVFELKKPYTNQSRLTRGAGELKLLKRGTVFSGLYWTDDQAHGTIKLERVSEDCSQVESFDDAVEKWPAKLVLDDGR